jgi:hypothetical protein
MKLKLPAQFGYILMQVFVGGVVALNGAIVAQKLNEPVISWWSVSLSGILALVNVWSFYAIHKSRKRMAIISMKKFLDGNVPT